MLSKDFREILKLWTCLIFSILFTWLFFWHLVDWLSEVYKITNGFEKSLIDQLDQKTYLLGFCLIWLYVTSLSDLGFSSFKLLKKLEVKNVK